MLKNAILRFSMIWGDRGAGIRISSDGTKEVNSYIIAAGGWEQNREFRHSPVSRGDLEVSGSGTPGKI
jgi:hypothetical protein